MDTDEPKTDETKAQKAAATKAAKAAKAAEDKAQDEPKFDLAERVAMALDITVDEVDVWEKQAADKGMNLLKYIRELVERDMPR